MGVTVDWLDERKTILCYTFVEKWEWSEFFIRWEWVRQALEASDHKASVILNFEATHYIPPNSLMNLRALTRTVHPNYSGATVYVGAGTLGTLYQTVFQKLNPDSGTAAKFTVSFAPTLEEARHLLDDWHQQHGL